MSEKSRAEGIENQEIAARLRISRPTVPLWRQRFLAWRAAGPEKDAPRPGRLPRISSSQVAAIVEATLHRKPPNATHWSTSKLRESAKPPFAAFGSGVISGGSCSTGVMFMPWQSRHVPRVR
jgi:transposase